MPTRRIGMCLLAICGIAVDARAQGPESYEGTAASPAPRTSASQRMVQRRAARQAEQRIARIENRRWTGDSAARPTVGQMWDPTERGMSANYPWLLYHPYPCYGPYYGPVVTHSAR